MRKTKRFTSILAAGLLAAGLAPVVLAQQSAQAAPVFTNPGPVGNGLTITPGDLSFILKQIKIAERHAATASPANPCGTLIGTGPDQIPDAITSYGLRTVDGSCNNLVPGRETFAAADVPFPRLTNSVFRNAEASPGGTGTTTPASTIPAQASSTYAQKDAGNKVFDTQPRVISNLIVDQTASNPAAVDAAAHPVRTQNAPPSAIPCPGAPTDPIPCTPAGQTLFIPNVTTDVGLSPPYNSLFTFFGQFFDHGVDQTVKSGGTVYVPLRADDPLITVGPDGVAGTGDEVPLNQAYMTMTRAQNQPGPDGILGTADDIQNTNNTDTPWVDQSQTYSSHSSHQVFLREYALNSASHPVSTGKLLGGLAAGVTYPGSPDGRNGIGTWLAVKAQALQKLGLRLRDKDVSNIPMIAADPYGKFIPGPARGLPQYVTTSGLVEGNLAAPVFVPANVLHFNTPFLTDVAHNADPGTVGPCTQTGNAAGCLNPDADTAPSADFAHQPPGTYDDEMLNAHFICGDGRCNENIALSTIHQVFHSEHDRLVDYIKGVLTSDTSATGVAALPEWQLPTAVNPAGWNGERLFQAARFVTEMEYQHLVFEEFARKVQPAVRPFHVYSPDINPAIEAEYAHAVYRFGHSMLDDQVARKNINGSDNSLPLLKAFLNPPEFFNGGTAGTLTPEKAAGSVVMGSSDQVGNELDEFVSQTLRNNLVGLPLDLPTLNITRARDAGVPPLNDVRRQIFAQTNDGQLAPYTSWNDYGQHLKHPASLINFVAAYGTHPTVRDSGPDGILGTGCSNTAPFSATNPAPSAECADNVTTVAAKRAAATLIVSGGAGQPADAVAFMASTGVWASNAAGVTSTGLDSVDLWVGGLAEVTNLFGGLLGTTFNYTFQNQLEKLQDGDRLYYLARTPGMNFRSQLEGNSFAELIQRNTDGTNTLKADAFATADCKFQLANLAGTPAGYAAFGSSVADDPTTTGCNENLLLLRKPDGTIQYRQFNTVNPSGINYQSVYQGTTGNDRVFGGNDNDTFWGGAGNDVIEGGGGDDVALGGAGNDIITDLSGADVLKGGPGNDAIDGGIGNDIVLGGDGQDFLNGGANDNETFAGPGNDYIIAGQGADTVFGDGGDDWIEGGTGQDLLQGDHGAPFLDDPAEAAPGNDIFIGQPGENDYDAEGGDDLMAQNPAIDRNAGSGGFDWAFHQYDTVPAVDDMMINNNLGGLGIAVIVNRDRWQETEADSGGPFNDTIKGTDGPLATPRLLGGGGFQGCDALDQAGVDRITGLAALLPPASAWPGTAAQTAALSTHGVCPLTGPVWGEGDILLGGPGSDTFTGRAGNEIIDGDKELRVAISVRNAAGIELGQTDLMEGLPTTGTFGPGTTGMTLQQAVFAGLVDPGNLVNVRKIVNLETNPSDCFKLTQTPVGTPLNCDTSTYAGPRSQYTITPNPDGSITVVDTTSPAPAVGVLPIGDGTDTLWNIERLQFSDGFVLLNTPAAPTGVTATAGNASATVGWTAPIDTGATPLTGFQVDVLTGTTVVKTVNVAGGTTTSTVITGLTNGTSYTFVVRAVNGVGAGANSAPSNTVVPITVPGAPTGVTATAGNAQATVSWTAPASDGSSAITGYTVQVIDASNVPVFTVAAPASPFVVTGLTNGTTYHFQVWANNAVGAGPNSASSNAVTPATVPDAPTGVAATAGDTTATVSWTAPVNNGGAAITVFQVWVLTGGRFVKAVNVLPGATVSAAPGSASSTVITGLTNGTTYTFQVRAANRAGFGPLSTPSNAVVFATVPGAPTIGTATAGNASATVRWTAPANGGSAITGYNVQVIDSTGTVLNTVPAGATATSLLVTGLTNGTVYHFQVWATNAVGSGVNSASSNSVTPATPPGAPVIGPASSGPVGTNTATATWTPPASDGGSAITGYRVLALQFNAAGTFLGFTASGIQPATARALTMTLPAGNYRFTVQALNAIGVSAQSAQSNGVTSS